MCSDGYDGDQQDGTQRSQAEDDKAVQARAAQPGDHSDWGGWHRGEAVKDPLLSYILD